MQIRGGLVFTGTGFNPFDIAIEGERFVAVEWQGADFDAEGPLLDATGFYVVPGLIDVHFHGCAGYDFCDGTEEAIDAIARYEASRGVTAICPATMTYPEDVLAPIMHTAAAYETKRDGAALVGINMEGPFVSLDNIGAQNPAYVQVCDAGMIRRMQQASGGLVKLVDIAPEEAGALAFIDEMAGEMRVSIAHTTADYECAREAFEHGARQLTHTYNAMPSLHHRRPGPIPAAFERDDVSAELIADGIHVHPAMVRMTFKLFGDERIILISDSMRATGLEDGNYDLGGQNVVVCGNRATLADGTIAGSATDLASCVKWAVREADIPLESAIKAATVNPARAIGIDADRGSIKAGKIADAVVFDGNLDIRHIVLRGTLLF